MFSPIVLTRIPSRCSLCCFIQEHLELASMRVKGTCQTLEKRYLRLTTVSDCAVSKRLSLDVCVGMRPCGFVVV